ncbi:MAG: universal stress protein, partial [Phycisphaerales bacterium]|nr:universal stress protein [Phycisphaerales bacterium]
FRGTLPTTPSGSGVSVETRLLEGELIPTLCGLARASDLIVVGKKGRFRAAGIGSATRSLVTRAPAPVMIVSLPFSPLRRVLGVFENSDAGRKAVGLAKELAAQTGWPLTILAVAGHGAELPRAEAMARELAGGSPVVPMRGAADEAGAIEQAAHEARDALLVMGAYAGSWLHQAFFGSTAPRALKDVGAPVVLAH